MSVEVRQSVSQFVMAITIGQCNHTARQGGIYKAAVVKPGEFLSTDLGWAAA